MRRLVLAACVVALAACGGVASPTRALNARSVLTGAPETLEFESPQARQDLYAEIARSSLSEAGRPAGPEVLFPVLQDGSALAAAGFDAHTDLLAGADAGEDVWVDLDGTDGWPEARKASLGGLSEKEVAELVARSLIARWNLHPKGRVVVERALGAPYAAAWADGMLRINPSFLYLASANAL
jgi:hypothetical protein